ncbi:MAG: thioredoxin domain-containing protein [Chromatiales bacterium]|nr:thioredoxin domain-containing protein [Chromatiales bacterium]
MKKHNHLSEESSPYLRQHADNPVEWYPWRAEALDKARREDKPIFLSIGYSACHWCHVMAHESFEDEATAQMMNDYFVNIKVDREERPDLDKIYQTSQLLINQRGGGWPLSMFLTPDDQIAFYGGTYFPKVARYGMPAFKDILKGVHDSYHQRRESIYKQNDAMQRALQQIYMPSPTSDIAVSLLAEKAEHILHANYDSRYGGFGSAPKFPQIDMLYFLIIQWVRNTTKAQSAAIALTTLKNICRGGIYDQIGGGLCRYSVDQQWCIPHFEKMLYDNGQLSGLLAQAWSITHDDIYRRKAIETNDWILRDMQSPQGAYYSSLDADSEGVEGKYYYWDKDELQTLLTADYDIAAYYFGIEGTPNFEGHWHLQEKRDIEETAAALKIPVDVASAKITDLKYKLLKQRATRIMPQRDDKILTSWNALMIKGMALSAYLLDRSEYRLSAKRALDFIRKYMLDGARLSAVCKDDQAHTNGYLDDYAFLIDAILYLNQAHWSSDDFNLAYALSHTIIDYFEDAEHGGFYFTSHDHERLVQRPRTLTDEALPAGYSLAATALFRMGSLLGEERFIQVAGRAIMQAKGAMGSAPHNYATLLNAAIEYDTGFEYIIIRGTEEVCAQWLRLTAEYYNPARLCFAIPTTATDLAAALDEKKAEPSSGQGVAYRCCGQSCQPPIKDLEELSRHLQATQSKLLSK